MSRTEIRKSTENAIYNAMKPSTLEDTMKCAEIINKYRNKCKLYDEMVTLCDNEMEHVNYILKELTLKADAIYKFVKSGLMCKLCNGDYNSVIESLAESNPLRISLCNMELQMLCYGKMFLMKYPDATVCIGKARKKFKLQNLKIEIEQFNKELIDATRKIEEWNKNICEIKSILETEREHTKLSIDGKVWKYDKQGICPIINKHKGVSFMMLNKHLTESEVRQK